MALKRYLAGNTIRYTWISSGVTPSDIWCATFNGSETLVNSITMASSGNGHYYIDYTLPDTPGNYVNYYNASINGDPYKNQVRFKVATYQVD